MIFTFKLNSEEEYFRVDYCAKKMISVYCQKGQRGIRVVDEFETIKTIIHTLLSDSPQYTTISTAEFFDVHNDIITELAGNQEVLYSEQFNN